MDNNNSKKNETLEIPSFMNDKTQPTQKPENLEETKVIPKIDDESVDVIDFGNVYEQDQGHQEDVFSRIKESLSEEEIKQRDAERLEKVAESFDETIVIPAQDAGGNGNGNGDDNDSNSNDEKDPEDDDMSKKKKKQSKYTKREKVNIALLTLVSLFIVGVISFATIWGLVVSKSDGLNVGTLANENSSKIYDMDNELVQDLGKMSSAAQENITYNQMPEVLVDAFIAVEDSRFFKHNGFDLPRFTKSFMKNIATVSFSQGGSTLSMQLIKNSHLSAQKTIARKIEEIDLSLKLEKEVNKKEIFANYLNMINYGAGNSRGIESSSLYFFNKPAKELNINESAIMAGVINAPNKYSPIDNLEKSYERRDISLNLMTQHGYITKKEAELAKKVKIENLLDEEGTHVLAIDKTPYLNYINVVAKEVKERTGLDPFTSGMRVYTNMDRSVQDTIEAMERSEYFVYPDELVQSAIAVVENDTGKLVGIGGGRDEAVAMGFSRVVDMKQQPGSVIKPILSYALAFEHLGWSTSHVVEDKPVQIAGTDHILRNFWGTYSGEVRLKDALATSLNTPPYATLAELQGKIGDKAIVNYLNSLGFDVKDNEFNTQYAIGGSDFRISPKELAGAQATFMNAGKYTEPHTVNKIILNDQTENKEDFEYPTTQVISPEAAYLTSVLEDYNVTSGSMNYMDHLAGKGYPVYAKTGTTDWGDSGLQYGIPQGAAKEHWMMASSKKYTSAVWLGYDKPIAGENTYFESWKTQMNVTGQINDILMNKLHENENPGRVERPEGVTSITHVLSVFPYAAPTEGMDEKYITTGEIAKKYAKLTNLDETQLDIEAASDFNVSVAAVGPNQKEITISWGEYPKDGAIAPETYDISIPGMAATGTRLFHPSWIFGPLKYKADVKVNDKVLHKVVSDTNSHKVTLDINDGDTIRVCGYYGNSQQNGSEKCTEPKNPVSEENIVIPSFKSEDEVRAFVTKHNLTQWTISRLTATNAEQSQGVAAVTANGADIRGKSYTTSKLKELAVNVQVYDKFVKPEEPKDPETEIPEQPEKPETP